MIVKYISTEFGMGKHLEEGDDIVKEMQMRSKKRLPRYEEEEEAGKVGKVVQQPVRQEVVKADVNPFVVWRGVG
jgi:hypothetical protein